ncbi:MAG: metallophosphoesterase [Archaeoglobus sp.]|nr:metallophosphoesterase [Archaeoglobus sp.]
MLKIIPDKPALLLEGRERWIVIADLHLGIVNFPDKSVIEEAVSLVEKERADGVIILGDLKHDIGLRNRERKEVELFKNSLFEIGIDEENIILVRGNHDGGLDDLIRIEPSSGFVFKNYGFFHGHANPSAKVVESKLLIFAHIHPAVMISDYVGGIKKRVWLSGEWDNLGRKTNVIVMPAFNELCSSIAVNVDRKIAERYKLWNLSATMLDGTNLGSVEMLSRGMLGWGTWSTWNTSNRIE